MTDALRREIPGPEDAPDMGKALRDYSLSDPPGPISVNSAAEANSVWADYRNAGGTQPLHIWREDLNAEFRSYGSGWEYVAGRRHAADVSFRREGINEGGHGLLLATQFHDASPGWTINGSAWLVIPETGLYIAGIDYNIEGGATGLGRVFFQLTLRDGGVSDSGSGIGLRVAATDENNWGGSIPWYFHKGQQLQIRGRAEGGGTRTHAARMVIAMLGDPNW